jgi:hypothetical protein
MNHVALIAMLASVIGTLIGVIVSIWISRKFLRKTVYTPSNAVELIKLNHPEEWNEVRILNPGWKPEMPRLVFEGAVLPTINLSRADLSGASFRGAILDGANFFEATLVGADFSGASLVGVRFDSANLRDAKLVDVNLQGASLENATLDPDDPVKNADEKNPTKNLEGRELLSIVAHKPDFIFWITPTQFDELVATVFRSLNYQVERTTNSIDSGYDMIVTRTDPVIGRQRFLVEAKRTKKDYKVGESSIRTLYAALMRAGADKGILITTTGVTANARRLVNEMPNIVIVDRDGLFDWIARAI